MSGFERLQKNDPAVEANDISVARIRRRALGQKRYWSIKTVAASIAVLTVVAGGAGAIGRMTAPMPEVYANAKPALDVPNSTDSKEASRSALWMGARVILNPTSSIGDTAGMASGFVFSSDGIDFQGLVKDVAALVGAKGNVQAAEGSPGWVIGKQDGLEPAASVSNDPTASFYGYNPERSPWNCVSEADKKYSPDTRLCTEEDFKSADKADAEKAFSQVLALLGIKADDVVKSFDQYGDPRSITVTANIKVAGQETNYQRFNIGVSARGIFSVNGNAAKLTEVKGYEIVGAKTAAERSQFTKWSSLGPNLFGDAGVMPMARGGVQDMGMQDTGSFMVGDKPGMRGGVETIDVSKARLGLVSYYSDNAPVMFPAWIFTSEDGREFSVIALTDKYIKF